MYVGVPSVTPVLVSLDAAAFGDRARDAEVGDQRLTVLQQDVLRLDVAVNDALLVRVVERRSRPDTRCAPRPAEEAAFSRSRRLWIVSPAMNCMT